MYDPKVSGRLQKDATLGSKGNWPLTAIEESKEDSAENKEQSAESKNG